jgi:HD-GYP domain-containing protein (c-di-GMP phosphodiesterase class II)
MSVERVVVMAGPLQGKSFAVTGTLTIGRGPENALSLDDLQISRKHAIIQQSPSGTVIRDLNSGNGTFIGDRRILEYRLADGDVIRMGSLQLRFDCNTADDEPEQLLSKQQDGSNVRFHKVAESGLLGSSAENIYQTFFSAPKESISTDQLREAQARLAAVYEANRAIASELDLRKVFETVMDHIFRLVPAHNGIILIRDAKTGELMTEFVKSGSGRHAIDISTTIVRRAYKDAEAVITSNAMNDQRFDSGASIIEQNITSAMCAPLIHQGDTLGVVYVDTRGTTNAFVQGDLELLVALCAASAVAIKNAQYLSKLQRAYQDTLIALANAIEMRDHYTVGHTWRVTNFALEIAKVLEWSSEEVKRCEMGGVLHDVGKIAIDDAILRKNGGLTDDEYAKMKVHPERGARLLQDIEFLVPLIPYALYHHERFDGKGYPYRLKGEDIPIEGRLLAVADTFDAMTSNRPYRKGLDPEVAIKELEKCKGSQFDPIMVDAFLKAYHAGNISRILQDYNKGDKSVACPFCSTFISIPEGSEIGDMFECMVCHRRVKILQENEAWYGELVASADLRTPTQSMR